MLTDPTARKIFLLVLFLVFGIVYLIFSAPLLRKPQEKGASRPFVPYLLFLLPLFLLYLYLPHPYGGGSPLSGFLAGAGWGIMALVIFSRAEAWHGSPSPFFISSGLSGMLGSLVLMTGHGDLTFPFLAFALSSLLGALMTGDPRFALSPILLAGGMIIAGLHWPQDPKGALYFLFLLAAGTISASLPLAMRRGGAEPGQQSGGTLLQGALAALLFAGLAYGGGIYLLGGQPAAGPGTGLLTGQPAPFWCAGMGILTALLFLIADTEKAAESRAGRGIGLFLLLFAQTAIAFLLLGGYGIALLAAALLSFSPFLSRPVSHRLFLLLASFPVFMVFVRIFLEQFNLTLEGIDLVQPYTFVALVTGASLPLLLIRGKGEPVCSATLLLPTLLIPFLIGILWKTQAVAGYLFGLALSLLFLLGEVSEPLAPESQDSSDLKWRGRMMAIHSQISLSFLLLLSFSPPLFHIFWAFSRTQKISLAAGAIILGVVWSLLIEPRLPSRDLVREGSSSPVP